MDLLKSFLGMWGRMLDKIRPNLILGLVALVLITWRLIDFAGGILTDDIVKENANVVLVGLFGLLSTMLGGVVGYVLGLKEALTNKGD